MTIKQQGGIFGRNPEFNDASVSNLTVKESLLPLGNGSLNLGGPSNRWDEAHIKEIHNDGTNLAFAAGGSIQARIRNNGEFDMTDGGGNIKLSDGAGINFGETSQAAGATSELFDDYEEGTFSPTLTTTGTDFDSVTYDGLIGGRYTKIGNTVHFQLYMITDAITVGSASGNVIIGNLPFTAAANSSGTADGSSSVTVGFADSWGGESPIEAFVNRDSTTVNLFYRATSDAASSAVQVSDVGTTPNDNKIRIAGTYIAA